MSLKFKYVPLSFLSDNEQIKAQIKNTIILKHYFDLNNSTVKLIKLIEGTQYGYNASALKSGDNKFLRISDITDGKVDWESVPYCDCLNEKTYLLNQDDILIARTGGTTGKSFLINDPPEKSIFAGYLIRIRANKESNPEFLNLFLNSYVYWSQITSLNKGEFRPSVNATKLEALLLPKCTEQQQLDAIQLSKGYLVKGYDKLSAEIEKTLLDYEKCKEVLSIHVFQKNTMQNLKQSILQDAIQGKLTKDWRKENTSVEPASELLKLIKAEKAQLVKDKKIKKDKPLPAITKEEIPFELPEGWVWCRLGDIGFTQTGSTPPKNDSSNYGDYIPFIQPGNITEDGLNFNCISLSKKGLDKGRLIRKGSNLMVCIGGSAGKTCFNEIDISCNQQINTFTGFKDVYHRYIDYCLKSPHFYNSVWNTIKKGSTPILNKGNWSKLLIPLCSFSEQKNIVRRVESLMNKCNVLKNEVEKSEANAEMLMQAVLKEAFEERGVVEEVVEVELITSS